MWPDRVSSPGPMTYKSGALPTALRGPAKSVEGETNFKVCGRTGYQSLNPCKTNGGRIMNTLVSLRGLLSFAASETVVRLLINP